MLFELFCLKRHCCLSFSDEKSSEFEGENFRFRDLVLNLSW